MVEMTVGQENMGDAFDCRVAITAEAGIAGEVGIEQDSFASQIETKRRVAVPSDAHDGLRASDARGSRRRILSGPLLDFCSRPLRFCTSFLFYDKFAVMNWDDLRIIAAVREEGTYAGASSRLRMDVTTVGR